MQPAALSPAPSVAAPAPPVLARFRPTMRQAVGRGLLLGAVVALASAGVAVARPIPAGLAALAPLAGALALLAGPLVGALLRPHIGANLDRLGAHGLPLALEGFAPWKLVVDVRPQRRRGRTVVAVELDDGTVQRLPAPYDGRLLGHDPEFARKLEVVRQVWQTYREVATLAPAGTFRAR